MEKPINTKKKAIKKTESCGNCETLDNGKYKIR